MLIAVRMKAQDKRKGFTMRTYVSANSRTKYVAGTDASPSPFRVVRSTREISELSRFPQFEVMEFDDLDHLQEFIQQEMEERARVGLPAVRATIMGGAGAKVEAHKVRPRPVKDRLPPQISGPTDPAKSHTGRRPKSEDEDMAPAEQPAEEKTEQPAEEPAPEKKVPKKKAAKKKAAKKKPAKKKAEKSRKRSVRPADEN